MQLVPRVNIRDMDFEDGTFEDLERIEHRNRCKRISRRIDDQRVGLFARRLDEIDQLAFMVRLVERELGACECRELLAALLYGRQSRRSIDVWLAHPEKVEVRTIQYHKPCCHGVPAHRSGLHTRYRIGDGQSANSATRQPFVGHPGLCSLAHRSARMRTWRARAVP